MKIKVKPITINPMMYILALGRRDKNWYVDKEEGKEVEDGFDEDEFDDGIVDEFNDLRSDIVLLFDLKNALNSAEYEFQTSLHRLKSENGPTNPAISSTQPLSASSSSSNDTSRTPFDFLLSQPSTPIDNITSPRLSDSFEPTNNIRLSTNERKRRAFSSQTSTIKKRDRQS